MDLVMELLKAVRIDFRPKAAPPRLSRVALATVVAIVGSLLADALIVRGAIALFPKTAHYAHFQFADYAKLTIIGVVGACLGWPILARISSAPRWVYLRAAVAVTVVLLLPDVYLLVLGQPADAVAALMVMHLAIAVVTYQAMVRLAPLGPNRSTDGAAAPRRRAS